MTAGAAPGHSHSLLGHSVSVSRSNISIVGYKASRLCLRERDGLGDLALLLQQVGHVADRDQRARVAVAQRLPLRLQRLLVQRPRLVQLAHLLQQPAHMLLIEVSVSGWRSPSISLRACSASSYSGRATCYSYVDHLKNLLQTSCYQVYF